MKKNLCGSAGAVFGNNEKLREPTANITLLLFHICPLILFFIGYKTNYVCLLYSIIIIFSYLSWIICLYNYRIKKKRGLVALLFKSLD